MLGNDARMVLYYDAGICANRYLAYTKKVEALGHKVCGLDKRAYNAMIKAWSNSGHPDASCKIVVLLKEKKKLAAKDKNAQK